MESHNEAKMLDEQKQKREGKFPEYARSRWEGEMVFVVLQSLEAMMMLDRNCQWR